MSKRVKVTFEADIEDDDFRKSGIWDLKYAKLPSGRSLWVPVDATIEEVLRDGYYVGSTGHTMKRQDGKWYVFSPAMGEFDPAPVLRVQIYHPTFLAPLPD